MKTLTRIQRRARKLLVWTLRNTPTFAYYIGLRSLKFRCWYNNKTAEWPWSLYLFLTTPPPYSVQITETQVDAQVRKR